MVTTNILTRSSVKASLEKAISLAKVQHPNEAFVSLPEPSPIPEAWKLTPKYFPSHPRQEGKDDQDLLTLLQGKGFHASGAFSNGQVELAVVNSLGVEAYQKYSDLFFHLIAENGKGTGYASFVARDPDQFDIDSLAQEAIRKVSKSRADFRLNPESTKSFLSLML